MTIAICKNRGTKKWGAFNKCNNCGFEPKIKDDLAESMLLSSHYFDQKTLEALSLVFQSGKPPKIDKQSRSLVKEQLHQLYSFLDV